MVYTLNIPTSLSNIAVPDARVFKAGVFGDVDSGQTRFLATRIWDTNGNPAIITKPDKVLILVAMVEQDDTGADFVRTALQTAMAAIAPTNIAPLLKGNDRAAFAQRMTEGMQGALKGALKAVVPPLSQDDLIGPVKQLPITSALLQKVGLQGTQTILLDFASSDARYTVGFKIQQA